MKRWGQLTKMGQVLVSSGMFFDFFLPSRTLGSYVNMSRSDLCDVTNNTQYIFSKGHNQQFSNNIIYETCYGIQLSNNLLYGEQLNMGI